MDEKAPNIVIGIDLGGRGGIAVAGDDPDRPKRCRLLATFALRERGKQKTTGHAYQEKLRELIRSHGVLEMAAEEPGTWGYRATVAGQRGWWDLAEAVAFEFRLPFRGYQPRTVKARAGGGARASKHDMLQAARMHFPTLETTHDGVADACCIAWLLWNDRRVEAERATQAALFEAPQRRPRGRRRRQPRRGR